MVAVNPDGSPGLVAPDELIESAWGNAVVRRLGMSLLGRATRNTDVPNIGTGGYAVANPISLTISQARDILIVAQTNLIATSNGAYLQATVAGVARSPRLAQMNNLGTGALLAGQLLVTLAAGTYTIGCNVIATSGVVTLAGASDPSLIELYDCGVSP